MKLLSLLALGALAAFTNAAAIDGGLVEKRCLEAGADCQDDRNGCCEGYSCPSVFGEHYICRPNN
ncbi:hypothetical protein NUU61_004225 [Penicillium alfredii]|uniref:Uncharacterized protein n=1 Tax=Penicillium alfredii TaxID=1506179 RepID=A0A9W9FKV6_9EURO|nr:uncharacterized protein NUU61_004225 [Penicillium alfredii]KAJ5102003.1 hypothetical protein NUU61_004225 [Penicillium alfredii]